MFAQVVKSGYFQLRQTPGVPLSITQPSQGHGGQGLWGLVVCPQTRRFQLALQTQKAEKLVKPKNLVHLTVRPWGAQGDAWGVGHGCTHHPGHAVKTCVWQNLLPYLSLLRPLVSDITSCCALTSCRCSFDTWDPIKNHSPKIWMVKWLWNYEHDIPWLLKTTKIAKLCVCMKTPFLSHSHRAHLIRPAFRTWLVEGPSWRLCWCLASGKRTPTPSSSRPRIQRLGYGVGANMCQLWSDQAQAKLCKTGIVLYWRKFAWWSMCTNLLRNGLGIALRNCQRIHYLWPLNHEHVIVHVRSALDVFI